MSKSLLGVLSEYLIICPAIIQRLIKLILEQHTYNILQDKTLSKHLKGRFGPRVGDGNVFAPKEVSWDPVLVT